MAKVKKLCLQNFKFFGVRQEFDLNGKNLLIYGENGSGKSSVYWAIHTLLESANKPDDAAIQKYFIDGDASLKNIFLKTAAPEYVDSEIILELDDTTRFAVSAADCAIRENKDAQTANYASEFLNYKTLFRIHDFVHGDEIDLFGYFEKEVFPYVKFVPVKNWQFKPDGSRDETENANQIWELTKNPPPKESSDKNGNKRFPRKRETDFAVYQNFFNGFKSGLDTLLRYINLQGNKILSENFNSNFEFKLEFVETRDFKITAQHFTPPQFEIKLEVTKFYGEINIPKPQIFLNEARLSALALAIRFAILQQRLQTAKLKLVLLDDFIISLDMNNRDAALEYVLSEIVSKYQTIILTHDRPFFEMAKKKIKSKGQKDDWVHYEMYEEKIEQRIQPFLTKSETYLEKAEKHIKTHDYEVAGNYLRKEGESICKEFLPKRLQSNKNNERLDLIKLIDNCSIFFRQNGLNKENFEKLNHHRDTVLNASSHDSYDVPKFRNELETCLENIKEIRKIKTIPILQDGDVLEFKVSVPGGSVVFKLEIFIHDDLFLIREDGKDSIVTFGIVNYFTYKNGVLSGNLIHTNKTLKEIYQIFYKKSDKTKSADFWDEIIIKSTNQPLKSLRVF